MNYPGHEEDGLGDSACLRHGDLKFIKQQLANHGRRTGSTQRATEAWARYGCVRKTSATPRREGNP